MTEGASQGVPAELLVDIPEQESSWQSLPHELLIDIARRVLQQEQFNGALKGLRQACKAGRDIAEAVVETVLLDGEFFPGNISFHRFKNLKHVSNLPSRCLHSLSSGRYIVSLSLTGTGSDEEYALLAKMPALEWLEFRGPVTLTAERFGVLGAHPQLKYLRFDNIMFPRLPFANHVCKSATFPLLQSLDLRSRNPFTRNGVQSGTAGRQFVSAMKSLKDLTIHMGAGSQVFLKTLDTLPAVRKVHLLRSAFIKMDFLDEWLEWAEPRQIRVELNSQQNRKDFPAIPLSVLRASGLPSNRNA